MRLENGFSDCVLFVAYCNYYDFFFGYLKNYERINNNNKIRAIILFFFCKIWGGGTDTKIKKSENHFSLARFVD